MREKMSPEEVLASQQMTGEQTEASELREKRLNMLGPDGTLVMKKNDFGGIKGTEMAGVVKGQKVGLQRDIQRDGKTAYIGTIGNTRLSNEQAELIWKKLEEVADTNMEASEQSARNSLEGSPDQAPTTQTIEDDQQLIDELLGDSGKE